MQAASAHLRARFQKMGIRPAEALFIGDQLYVDVYGALNCGMDVALDRNRTSGLAAAGIAMPGCKPTYTVSMLISERNHDGLLGRLS